MKWAGLAIVGGGSLGEKSRGHHSWTADVRERVPVETEGEEETEGNRESGWRNTRPAMNRGPKAREEEEVVEEGRKIFVSTFCLNLQPTVGPHAKNLCEVEEVEVGEETKEEEEEEEKVDKRQEWGGRKTPDLQPGPREESPTGTQQTHIHAHMQTHAHSHSCMLISNISKVCPQM